MKHFTPILHPSSNLRLAFFFKKIACRVHIIINRQMKCETWNFQSFLIQESFYCTPSQICFVPLTICLLSLPRVYILFVYILWHDEVVQWADNSDIWIFSKEGPFLWQTRYFNSILGPTAYLFIFRLLGLEL